MILHRKSVFCKLRQRTAASQFFSLASLLRKPFVNSSQAEPRSRHLRVQRLKDDIFDKRTCPNDLTIWERWVLRGAKKHV